MFRKLNFLYLQLLNSFGSSSKFQVQSSRFKVSSFKAYAVSVILNVVKNL